MNMIQNAKDQVLDLTVAAYGKAAAQGLLPEDVAVTPSVEIPKDTANGDYTTTFCLAAAKALKKNPRQVSQILMDHMDLAGSYFTSVEMAGPGFLNFRLGDKWFRDTVACVEREGADYGCNDTLKGQKIMVEFVSANPTGPMHMGNARGGVLGDTLASVLQKSGHGSYVDLPNGETYLVHLTSRPFVPELRCTLGRETAIQKMTWTNDGWLRMADGSNLAKLEVEEPDLPDAPMPEIPGHDDFDGGAIGNWYYSPRQMPTTFANVTERPGWLRIRGEESLASLNRTSLIARKLTSVYATVTTKMEFEPEVYQHSAGLTIYYDNMNNIFLRKYYSQTLGGSAISIVRLENGEKTEMLDTRVAVEDKPIYFRLNIEGRRTWFEWGYDGENWTKIGPDFDTTTFSDEYCKYGEFTGTMVGIAVTDAALHEKTADFDFFDYEADETKPVD